MRKLLLVVTLLGSTVALAANWKLIIDGSQGTRLLVDTDSVGIDKYQKENGSGARVYATMEMLNGNDEVVFRSIIDADDCLSKQEGGTLVNIYSDRTTASYFWSMNGSKLYDAEGQWLCGYLQGTIEVYQKNKEKEDKKKPKVTM